MLVMDRLAGIAGGGAGEVSSFTAGDLTIRRESGSSGRSLSAQAEELLAPWLGETRFVFQGVAG